MKQLSFILFLAFGSCFFLWSNRNNHQEEYINYDTNNDSIAKRIKLGRYLFYDNILSRDSSLSCASCHIQSKSFTDGEKTSIGFKGQRVSRNSPTLINVGNRKMFLLDGVNASLESQVTVPIQEHKEFDFHILLIQERLRKNSFYTQLSLEAYGRLPDPKIITESIATFERKMTSYDAPFDRYLRGDKKAISKEAKKGSKLFFDKMYCGKCHNGPDLTNDSLGNNGLYAEYKDKGRNRLTSKQEDIAIFKVPTLRNIMNTAPYMHDGSLATIEDVLNHYESGGKNHQNKSELITPFKLNKKEKHYLFEFFHSLTDSTILKNSSLSSPFEQ